jgi:hypothetical protein
MSAFSSKVAIPQKLVYDKTVHVDLSANQINLADADTYGHRVVVEVPTADLNGATEWVREVGSLYPVGTLKSTFTSSVLNDALDTQFVDLDAQPDGLNFSSSALDTTSAAGDARLRADPAENTVNDWVVAYVLYKLYGKSVESTKEEVFNIEDLRQMLRKDGVVNAIATSLSLPANQSSAQKLFKDLLVSDPKRFFDASGVQLPGLFEVNPASTVTSGEWQITAGDVIEIRLEFEFKEAITRRDIADSQLDTNGNPDTGANSTKEILTGEKFYIRLQVKAV